MSDSGEARGEGWPLWNGTDAELDDLIVSLHADTSCVDCVADPSQCCIDASVTQGSNAEALWDAWMASCVGHVVLASQPQMDNLLAMRRMHTKRDERAFQNGVGAWWSANVDPETLITP